MEMMSDGDRIMVSWINNLFEETKENTSNVIADEDTERGAAGLLDLFRTVDSNSNGAAEAVVNEDINGSSQNVNNNNDNNGNVDRNDNNDNNNDDNNNDTDDDTPVISPSHREH